MGESLGAWALIGIKLCKIFVLQKLKITKFFFLKIILFDRIWVIAISRNALDVN